jgi:hypothetical protein
MYDSGRSGAERGLGWCRFFCVKMPAVPHGKPGIAGSQTALSRSCATFDELLIDVAYRPLQIDVEGYDLKLLGCSTSIDQSR